MLYNRYKNSIKISGDFDCVGAFQKDLIVFENTANGGYKYQWQVGYRLQSLEFSKWFCLG